MQRAARMNMRFTRTICGMIGRLVKGQHWRDAGIEPIENRAPFALRTRAEYRLDPARAVGPDVGVEIVRKIPGVEAKPRQKRIVELALERVTPREFRHDAHHWLILHGRYVCKARKPECWHCAIEPLCDFRPKTPAPKT